jgi:hypothetical protein
VLFSLATALLGILAAVFAVNSAAADDPLSGFDILVLLAAGLAYCVAVYGWVTAYLARSWKAGPNLRQVWDDLWRDDETLGKW